MTPTRSMSDQQGIYKINTSFFDAILKIIYKQILLQKETYSDILNYTHCLKRVLKNNRKGHINSFYNTNNS